MFTKLYLDTTNPKLELSNLFQPQIFTPMIISILFHTIIYISFFNLISYLFLDKYLSSKINIKMLIFLIVFMFFGFIARIIHVKDVYHAYNNDMDKTIDHLNKLYISWIFIS